MAVETNFLAFLVTLLLVTGGESRRLLEVSEAPPVHSETPTLSEPTLPMPKVELPPLPEIPKVALPPIPSSIPTFVPVVPKIPIPEGIPPIPSSIPTFVPAIPKLPIPFAPPHAKESP